MSYLSAPPPDEATQAIFDKIENAFGFVPNMLKGLTARPDLIEARQNLAVLTLVKEGALPRALKEYIFLTCSAANMSTYCVTAHCEMVRMLKLEGPDAEQIAIDHTATDLPMRTKALLNFGLKLNSQPLKIQKSDIEALHKFGYTDPQIMEAILVVGMAQMANTVAFGLGTVPDFEPVELPAHSAK